MSNRLTRIVTRTGDNGTTGLGNGERRGKNDPRIVALGEVDELNSVLGVLAAETLPEAERLALSEVQHDLFDLGGELAVPGYSLLSPAALQRLDTEVAEWNAQLPPLREFILPGGSRTSALAHQARTVCRRAERALAHLADVESLAEGQYPLPYLNRLSDWLFVLARRLNQLQGVGDVLWKRERE